MSITKKALEERANCCPGVVKPCPPSCPGYAECVMAALCLELGTMLKSVLDGSDALATKASMTSAEWDRVEMAVETYRVIKQEARALLERLEWEAK